MNNKDLPAFPVECIYTEDGQIKGNQTGNVTGFEKGLSKIEYIAAMAMQGLLANPIYHNPNEKHKMITVGALTETAIIYADALLKKLEKQPVP